MHTLSLPARPLLWEAVKTTFLALLAYDFLLLRPWPVWGTQSVEPAAHLFFWLLMLLGAAAGFYLTPSRRWMGLGAFAAVALPLELYSLPVLFSLSRPAGVACLVLAGVSLAGFCLLIARQSPPPGREAGAGWRKLRHCLRGSRYVLSLSLSLSLLLLAGLLWTGEAAPADATVSQTPAGSITDHLPALSRFREDRWPTLSQEEKTTLLQLAADLEAHHLGLPTAPQVQAWEPDDPTIRGAYTHSEHAIRMNTEVLAEGDGFTSLETLLHECCHSYQWYLCEAYAQVPAPYRELALYLPAKRYQLEFSNYVDDGSADYYNQYCEVEARSYAQERLALYHLWLDEPPTGEAPAEAE